MTNNTRKSPLFYVFAAIVVIVVLVIVYQQIAPSDSPDVMDEPFVQDSPVTPVPEFGKIENVVEKKKAFFAYLIPEIKKQNAVILEQRQFVLAMQQKIQQHVSLSNDEKSKLASLASVYKVDETLSVAEKLKTLTKRVDVVPAELVLVQAANESAWGTSRFAKQGYNFFGMWCFSKGCGFVPKQRNDGAVHEVAKFKSLSHAVRSYMQNLNRHNAYRELRDIRLALRSENKEVTAEKLVHGLSRYSERGQEYIDELLQMIKFNKKFMQV